MLIQIILIPIVVFFAIYLSFSLFYKYILALSFFFIKSEDLKKNPPKLKLCIVIPAHNEMAFIERLIESIYTADYPRRLLDIFVIADNCSDSTADIARKAGTKVLERNNPKQKGKGYALQWAFQRVDIDSYDAVCVFDADNIIAQNVLKEFNDLFLNGYEVVQCSNSVYNKESSWFTEIQAVSRELENRLWHGAKFKLGLSPSLKGNGMGFLMGVLKKHPWKAFSISEDVEYYAHLVENGVSIGYSLNGIVYHQESTSFNEGYSQRLRWSGGKFDVARKCGLRLAWKGIKEKNWNKFDAGLFFLLPYTSLQINLHFLSILLALLCYKTSLFYWLFTWTVFILFLQIFYLIIGLVITKPSMRTVCALLKAPFFLFWKGYIDILGSIGVKNKEWKRGARPKKKR